MAVLRAAEASRRHPTAGSLAACHAMPAVTGEAARHAMPCSPTAGDSPRAAPCRAARHAVSTDFGGVAAVPCHAHHAVPSLGTPASPLRGGEGAPSLRNRSEPADSTAREWRGLEGPAPPHHRSSSGQRDLPTERRSRFQTGREARAPLAQQGGRDAGFAHRSTALADRRRPRAWRASTSSCLEMATRDTERCEETRDSLFRRGLLCKGYETKTEDAVRAENQRLSAIPEEPLRQGPPDRVVNERWPATAATHLSTRRARTFTTRVSALTTWTLC